MSLRLALLAPLALLLLTACKPEKLHATQNFWQQLQALCGNAYPGVIVSTDAADEEWRKQDSVMYVRECSKTQIKIPYYVGEDRSRTWVITKDMDTLELRHDHRHEDGSEDALTQYGGFNTAPGNVTTQNFPADDSTKALFDREEIPVSKQNTWTIEVKPDEELFAYQMSRPNRLFRVEFDTSKPLADKPAAPWGHE